MELGTGIIMDIAAIAILLASTVLGARKGLALTVASFMQWFLCVAAGFIFCGKMKTLLTDYTELDEFFLNSVKAHVQTSIEESSVYRALPDLFSGFADDSAQTLSYDTAASITSALMTVVAFLTVVLCIKLVFFLIVHLLSRRYNDGVAGFIDGFLGFLFGLARGLILTLLFFALLVPVLSLLWPELTDAVSSSIEDSRIAKLFYDNNVLLILVRDFFS